jgi:PIN domain nuclease of toxin-antitoxin system
VGVRSLIVLDTHVWLWWQDNPERLSRRAAKEIDGASRIGIPAICCWEAAHLFETGKVTPSIGIREWLESALAEPGVELLPISPAVAALAAGLESGFPGDPADRLIAATAIIEAATLITKDERLLEAPGVRAVW